MASENPPSRQSEYGAERIAQPSLSYWSDHLLHVWECPHVLKLAGGNPDFIRCGHLSHGPGNCPYPHDGEPVAMVEIKALVLCSECEEPIMRDDGRAPDGRLICGQCALGYIASGAYKDADRA